MRSYLILLVLGLVLVGCAVSSGPRLDFTKAEILETGLICVKYADKVAWVCARPETGDLVESLVRGLEYRDRRLDEARALHEQDKAEALDKLDAELRWDIELRDRRIEILERGIRASSCSDLDNL